MGFTGKGKRLTAEQLDKQLETVVSFLKAVHPGLLKTDGYKPSVELRPIPRGISKDDKHYYPLTWSLNIWSLDDQSIGRIRQFLSRHNGQTTCLFYSIFNYDNSRKVQTKQGTTAKVGKITTENALETEEIALDFDDLDFDGYVDLVDRFEDLGIFALWTSSGHGYQAHILLDKPMDSKDVLKKAVYKFRSKGFDCDAACIDPARVMRLPGTFNNKCFKEEKYASEQDDPPRCEIMMESSERYSFASVIDRLNELPTVSVEDDAAFLALTAPKRKAPSSLSLEDIQGGGEVAQLKRAEYPYISELDLPEAVERMLAFTPQGYRNKALGFMIRFFRTQYKLGSKQCREILEIWGRDACDPPYESDEFNADFKRLYYQYKGLPYDPALAKKFGTIDFETIRLRKKNLIYIPHSFFQSLDALSGKEVRAYLAIKLLEHTEEPTDIDSLSVLLGISRRSVQPTLQSLLKTGHCYCKKGVKRFKVPNTYHSSHIVTTQEGYMSFTYNDIRAYVMELCDLGERNRTSGALKLYLFFRWKFYSGDIFMSQAKLGEHLGLAQNSISHIVYGLQDRHFIQIRKIHHTPFLSSCEYILLR